jgi:hypothetical protein
MECSECRRLTRLFEAAILANAKIGFGKINASPEMDRVRVQFTKHYALHKKAGEAADKTILSQP